MPLLWPRRGDHVSRDDFAAKNRLVLAKRASFICSNPECRVLTIAPADWDAASVIFIGKAAHITAAAAGGPRFDAHMTADERSSLANGIFLCAACADIVDANGGADYPPKVLRRWKQDHEAWAREQLNRRPGGAISEVAGLHEATGVGDVTGLEINAPVIIKAGTVSRADGVGRVTATRIGPRPQEEP